MQNFQLSRNWLLNALIHTENSFLVEIPQNVQQALLRNWIPYGDVDRTDAKQQGE